MINSILFFAHYVLLLFFGVTLSLAFSGLKFSRKVLVTALSLFVVCGLLQGIFFVECGEDVVWRVYPFITHLPIIMVICLIYRKRLLTAIAAVVAAYLCCQPAKWFGLVFLSITQSTIIERLVRIVVLILLGVILIFRFASYIAQIYNKDNRSVLIFSSIPIVYYLFDYVTSIYTDFWTNNNNIASEFLAFFLCMAFLLFCLVYYKEYEQKMDAERKEQIIRIASQQYANEVDAIRKSEMAVRLLRHDMRLLLNNLALSIEQDDKEYALKMISGYVSSIDATAIHRYCANDTVNYVITNYEAKCRDLEIKFSAVVEITDLAIDEIMFSSILSNALDNALNAQLKLPDHQRNIKVMLKSSDGKLLLSVRNPYKDKPILVDGMPISPAAGQGHGYGTTSIRYMTERLGGNCQFVLEENQFVVRVII